MYTRFVVQESKRQVNLEAVVQAAEEQLHATPDAEVSAEPVDETWKTRFFSAAQDVSDDEMRRLWGAVLAGEVKQPKSFSLRCLDVLRNLSPGEAQRFQRLLPIVTAEGVAVFGKAGRDVPLTFDERSSLADAGLIHADNGLVIQQLIVVPGEKFQSTVVFHDLALWVAHDSPSNNLEFPACVLTDAGRQLAKLTEVSADPRHLDLLKKLAVAKGFRATIHRVLRNLGSHWLVTKDEFDVDASGQLVPVAPIAAEANVASPAPDSSPA